MYPRWPWHPPGPRIHYPSARETSMSAKDTDGDARVHELFRDYVAHVELGEAPSLAEYQHRLAYEPQRRLLAELIQALETVNQQLPPWVGPDALVADRYRILLPLGKGGMARV